MLGFQTEDDRTAFADYVLRQAGGSALDGGRLAAFERTVKTGVYPIGVHVDEVRARGRGAGATSAMRRGCAPACWGGR